MDSQSYLNEISAATRPVGKSKFDFLKSKYFIIGAAVVGCFILFALIGMLINGGKERVKEQTVSLYLRISTISDIVTEYQPSVKSSDLRSSSASLTGVLTNTNRELSQYVQDKYNYDEKKFEKLVDSEADHREELNTTLFSAKINGILDRIYAHKIAYEMAIMYSMEESLLDATNDDTLKELLTTSMSGLDNIYNKFDEFSEAK